MPVCHAITVHCSIFPSNCKAKELIKYYYSNKSPIYVYIFKFQKENAFSKSKNTLGGYLIT